MSKRTNKFHAMITNQEHPSFTKQITVTINLASPKTLMPNQTTSQLFLLMRKCITDVITYLQTS